MTSIFTRTALGTALAASVLATATPASAQEYYGHRDHGDATGAAIAGGIIGLALGAIIVSSSHHDHDRDRYDRRYYNNGYNGGGYYQQGYNGYNRNTYNGYYNNGYNNQYRGNDGDRRGYDNDRGDYRRGY